LFKIKILIAVLLYASAGCSVLKKNTTEPLPTTDSAVLNLLKQTRDQNISNNGFFIQRGRISTSGAVGRINLMFTLKFSGNGEYLISLRSGTGMEAFRVFLTKDTVLINDRINQNVLCGDPYEFARITGVPPDLMVIIFGDIFRESNKAVIFEDKSRNEIKIDDYFLGLQVKSIVDSKIKKVKSVMLTTGIPDEFIEINYSKYKGDKFKIPGMIEVNDFRRNVKITVRIEKYSAPWYGELEFVPGKGYGLKKL
jgi:hypothetical protein